VETLTDTALSVNEAKTTTNGCCSNSDVGLTSKTAAATVATDDTEVTSLADKEKSAEARTESRNSHGHRAGFDAFMTGCVFAWSVVSYNQKSSVDQFATTTVTALDVTNSEFVNRVYLGGKDFPLHVTQSAFAKPSKCHLEKWRLMNSAVDAQ